MVELRNPFTDKRIDLTTTTMFGLTSNHSELHTAIEQLRADTGDLAEEIEELNKHHETLQRKANHADGARAEQLQRQADETEETLLARRNALADMMAEFHDYVSKREELWYKTEMQKVHQRLVELDRALVEELSELDAELNYVESEREALAEKLDDLLESTRPPATSRKDSENAQSDQDRESAERDDFELERDVRNEP
jgi:predicted  nucleic acid-binding Zn-ribbon protein